MSLFGGNLSTPLVFSTCFSGAQITLASMSTGFLWTATSTTSGASLVSLDPTSLTSQKLFDCLDGRESPWWDPEHNICGAQHSGTYAGACFKRAARTLRKDMFDLALWVISVLVTLISFMKDTQIKVLILANWVFKVCLPSLSHPTHLNLNATRFVLSLSEYSNNCEDLVALRGVKFSSSSIRSFRFILCLTEKSFLDNCSLQHIFQPPWCDVRGPTKELIIYIHVYTYMFWRAFAKSAVSFRWPGAGCGHSGPYSVFDCSKWFGSLWDRQSGTQGFTPDVSWWTSFTALRFICRIMVQAGLIRSWRNLWHTKSTGNLWSHTSLHGGARQASRILILQDIKSDFSGPHHDSHC